MTHIKRAGNPRKDGLYLQNILGIGMGFSTFLMFNACAEPQPRKVKIDPPALVNTDAIDEAKESGDMKEEPSQEIKEIITDPVSEMPSPVDPGDVAKPSENSLSFFTASVHPTLVEWCGSCHKTGVQPPFFADADSKKSYDEILAGHKMDFVDPLASRLYQRINKENHQCPPALGCEGASNKLASILDEWVKASAESKDVPKIPVEPKLTSTAKLISERTGIREDSGVPEGSFYFAAESGVLKAPFVIKDRKEAEGGKTIFSAAGSGTDLNLATAGANAALGTVVFTVNVTKAGDYHAVGRVGSPNANAANNSSFYIKADNGPLLLWDFPGTNNTMVYDKADAVAAVGTPHVFNLAVGSHTFEIRQRQDQAELDSFILSSDLTYDFTNFAAALRKYNEMEFDISSQSGIEGAKLTLDIGEYDEKSYIIKNPRVVLNQGKARFKGLKILINDKFLPQHATFLGVDEIVEVPGKLLSKSSLVALKDKGTDTDKFSVSFEVIEKMP